MRYKGLFRGEKRDKKEEKRSAEMETDILLLDTDAKLRSLYDRYKVILNKEIMRARADQRNGIKNQDNYAKIGVAYYSMSMIKRAQKRMEEMTSARALFNCMNEMNSALQAINGLNGRLGRMDARKTVRDMKKMSGSSGGTSNDLKKTLQGLEKLDGQLPGEEARNTGISELVSVELIEKLIGGVDVDKCASAQDGIMAEAEEIIKEYEPSSEEEKQTVTGETLTEEEDEEVDVEKLRALLDSM